MLLLATGLATIIGLSILILALGTRRGTEFSPHLFQQRDYTFVRLPLTDLQITPAAKSMTTNPPMTHLTTQGLVQPIAQGARWDAAEFPGAADRFPRGDVAVILQYLDAVDSHGELVWLQWTKDHPDYAKSLWPAVALLARDGLYLPLPELFSIARLAPQGESAEAFGQTIDRWLFEQYRWYADAEQQQGNTERAALYRRRARSGRVRAFVGKSDEATGK
jgi:hypothetical protein